MGGIVLSQWVAYWLQNEAQAVHAVFAEEENDYRILKRGYDKIVSGKNCLVVEDIINSGGTVKKPLERLNEQAEKLLVLEHFVIEVAERLPTKHWVFQNFFLLLNLTNP